MKSILKKLSIGALALAVATGTLACRSRAEAAVAVPVVVGLVAVAAVGGLIIGSRMHHSQGYIPMKYRDDAEVGYRSSSAVNRCAEKYKSFNAKTGMVTINGGIKKPCPYLIQ